MQYCCDRMKSDLSQKCGMHRNRLDCPDNLIHYSARFEEFGLIIHDGTRSVIRILFCPWCGKDLEKLTAKPTRRRRIKAGKNC